MRLPFMVLALVASAASGQAVTKKPKNEKAKSNATAVAKRKGGDATSGKSGSASAGNTGRSTAKTGASSEAVAKAGSTPSSRADGMGSPPVTSITPKQHIPPTTANKPPASGANSRKTVTVAGTGTIGNQPPAIAARIGVPPGTSFKPSTVSPVEPAPPIASAHPISPTTGKPVIHPPLTQGDDVEIIGDVLPEVPERRSDLRELSKSAPREVSAIRKIQAGENAPPMDNAGEEPVRGWRGTGANVTLKTEDLPDLAAQPLQVQTLVREALELTSRNLRYQFGSADPTSGGLDCSGVIQYLLKNAGLEEVPRDSTGLYLWAEKSGTLQKARPASLDDPALAELRPGDLMFWEGTYDVKRDPPISHVMLYLGREKQTGLPVMVGSSDGRTYAGIRRKGVSVFDFKLPKAGSKARFVGYARVPGLLNATASR